MTFFKSIVYFLFLTPVYSLLGAQTFRSRPLQPSLVTATLPRKQRLKKISSPFLMLGWPASI